MSIRKKIIGGFLIVFLIGLSLGITGLVSTKMIQALTDEQVELQKASAGVSTVLNAHYTWRQTLTEAVLYMKPFTGSLDPTTCALGKWKDSDEARRISDPTILSLLAETTDPHTFIHTEAKEIVALIDAGDFEEAKRVLEELVMPRTQETISILTAMEERYTVMLDDSGAELTKRVNTVVIIIAAMSVAAFIVSFALAVIIIKSIMNPLRAMARAARVIATGDLDVHVEYAVNDEIGKLADAFGEIIASTTEQAAVAERLAKGDLTVSVSPKSDKDVMSIAQSRMIEKLNEMFAEIQTSASQVSLGSKQIADGAQSLSQGSSEQSAAVEELSGSIAEIAEKTKRNADMAARAAELAQSIKGNAEKGTVQMDQMMEAVKEINAASQNINKVIKVIDDIAFQTNILALNAAVEAARAGQHGKGFAVVAEEVRSLAAKSAEAAKDTGTLITNSIEKAEMGTRIAGDTAESLAEIVSGINESTQIVSEIAKSSEEQTASILDLNNGIEQVSQVVQQNSAAAEQSSAASQQMSGQSEMLEQLISQFKLRDGSSSYSLPQKAEYSRTDYETYTPGVQTGDYGKY